MLILIYIPLPCLQANYLFMIFNPNFLCIHSVNHLGHVCNFMTSKAMLSFVYPEIRMNMHNFVSLFFWKYIMNQCQRVFDITKNIFLKLLADLRQTWDTVHNLGMQNLVKPYQSFVEITFKLWTYRFCITIYKGMYVGKWNHLGQSQGVCMWQ